MMAKTDRQTTYVGCETTKLRNYNIKVSNLLARSMSLRDGKGQLAISKIPNAQGLGQRIDTEFDQVCASTTDLCKGENDRPCR